MSGNTCGCRMSWTYRWAIMVPMSSTRGDRVMYEMTSHTITPAAGTVCQPGAFVWFEKTQEPLVKVLHVPRWRLMKQLAVRVHLLRCGCLLDEWSVEGVLSLVNV
ncbi:uncharacterized protein TNCV_4154291 [Trichonephila clavipes]|nr:uncharacterized protein TNCV_4154291 [Trichonephila clavipes]